MHYRRLFIEFIQHPARFDRASLYLEGFMAIELDPIYRSQALPSGATNTLLASKPKSYHD
jgi:hypothetical protein